MSGTPDVGALEDEGSGSSAVASHSGRRRPSASARSGVPEAVLGVIEEQHDPFVVVDSAGKLIYANRWALRLFALSVTTAASGALQDITPGLREAGLEVALARAVSTLEPVEVDALLGQPPEQYAVRVFGTPSGVGLSFRRLVPSPATRDTLRLMLAAANGAAPPGFDEHETLRRIARMLVPAAADACAMMVLDEQEQRLAYAAAAASDPEIERLIEDRAAGLVARQPQREYLWETVRSGNPRLFPRIHPERLLTEAGDDPAYAELLQRLHPRSAMLIPLDARGHRLGAMALLSTTASRTYGQADLDAATQVARHIALALDNLRAYGATRDANRRLAAERDRLTRLLDVFPEGVLLVDASGTYTTTNVAACEILGSDLLGQHLGRDLAPGCESYYPDGSRMPAEEMPLRRALSRGETMHAEQLVVRRVDVDREIALLANSAPLVNESGAVDGAVLVFQDVTTIQALGQQKDVFLRTVSHDLKNRLNAAMGWAQVLERRLARVQEAERNRFTPGLRALNANLQRLGAMVDDLVDLTRLQLGRPLPLRRTSGDLVAIVRSIALDQQQSTDRHRIRLDTTEPSILGEWDVARIERVVANLLSNAIKYSPRGGDVVVSVEVEENEQGEWAILRVRDHGIGIPTGDLSRVFQLYQRGSNVSGEIEGTGLGLAGAQQIVSQHGGSIEVESVEGQGSTFITRLPVSTRESRATTAELRSLEPEPALDDSPPV